MRSSIPIAVLGLWCSACGSSSAEAPRDELEVGVGVETDSSSAIDTSSVGTDTASTDTFAGDTVASDTAPLDGALDADSAAPRPPCKRGIAYGHHSVSDLTALSTGISWWYDWSPHPDDAAIRAAFPGLGVDFTPMVWGGTFTVADVESQIPSSARFLLGFNEPNFNSQANLTPTQAAALWPQVERIAKDKGLTLVSPALNYCGGGCNVTDPYDWLDQFFAACTGCKVEAIAVHWYACTKPALNNYLKKFETKYARPVWLTEFSCLDATDVSEPVQEAYMKEAVPVLEADPMIARYAWFSGRFAAKPTVNLLGDDGKLTALGKLYVGLPQACRP